MKNKDVISKNLLEHCFVKQFQNFCQNFDNIIILPLSIKKNLKKKR